MQVGILCFHSPPCVLQSEHFPFINCVETLAYEHKYPEWESCFDKLNLDPKPIEDCYSSGYGKEVGFLFGINCPQVVRVIFVKISVFTLWFNVNVILLRIKTYRNYS
jgi:hypothetical protein